MENGQECGTWNVRGACICQGHLSTATREYAEQRTELVALQQVARDRCGGEPVRTLPDLRNSYILEGQVQVRFCASWNCAYTSSTIYNKTPI
jgi:hypothetical protein